MTDAEAESSFKICREIKEAFGYGISSIPIDNIDNIDNCVAARTVEKLDTEGEPRDCDQVIVCRDCVRCFDLMPKNLIDTAKIKDIMGEAKEVYNFTSTHCIISTRNEMVNTGTINKKTTVKNVVDTRMNLIEIYLSSARKQSTFLAALPQNAKWTCYYNKRN